MKITTIKKNLIFLFVMFVFFSIPVFARASVLINVPSNNIGMVGYWSFNGPDMSANASVSYDRSGQGNNGALKNRPLLTAGRIGQALSFDGVNDYVALGNPTSLQITGSLTVSAWVYPREFKVGGNDDTIVSKSLPGVNLRSWEFKGSEDCGPEAIQMDISSDGLTGGQRCGATTLKINTWYHAVGVYNASALTIDVYLNGVLNNGTLLGSVPASIFNSAIGTRIGSKDSDQQFTGLIDEVRVYNRALSAGEVKQLYNSGQAKINSSQNNILTNGLVGLWSFDGADIDGTTAYDRSGNGNSGTLTGTVRAAGRIGQALNFDGVDDRVNAGSSNSLSGLGPLTYSAWIYPRTFGVNSQVHIIDRGQRRDVTINNIDATGSAEFHILHSGTSLSAFVENNAIVTGQWQHLVVTWDGSVNRTGVVFYVNGVRKTTQTGIGADAIGTPSADTAIDQYISGSQLNRTFDGLIDEVRIYNRALSAGEIKQLYSSGLAKINSSQNNILTNGLVGMWSFNGADMSAGASVSYDRSGQGNNGALKNGPVLTAGRIGQALSFDGADDGVNAGNNSSLDVAGGNATWATWAYPLNANEGSNYVEMILDKESGGNGSGGIVMFLKNNNLCIYNGSAVCGSLNVPNKKWTHLAIVKTGSSAVPYINGVPDTTLSWTGGSQSTVAQGIGYDATNANGEYTGFLDEVRIYNRALSAGEVKQLYNLGR